MLRPAPEVELLVRLGVAGGWDIARDDAWDLPRPQLSPEASAVGTAGWVARLSSGMADLEAAAGQTGREVARNEAVIGTLDALDAAVLRQNCDPKRLVAYDGAAIAALGLASPGSAAAGCLDALRAAAEAALASGPYSVLRETSVAPSGDRQDCSAPGALLVAQPHHRRWPPLCPPRRRARAGHDPLCGSATTGRASSAC